MLKTLLLLLCSTFTFAAPPQLPAGAQPLFVEVDNAGHGYVAGLIPQSPNSESTPFVMKYRLDSGARVYLLRIRGSSVTPPQVNAIALDASGALYISGPGSPETTIG